MSQPSYGGLRFLALRNGTGRLGFGSRQAALLLRGNDVVEGWTDQASGSQTWTPATSGAESWTDK